MRLSSRSARAGVASDFLRAVAMASHANPALPYEVADDYLRVVMLTLMNWAWARIDVAAAGEPDASRWTVPAAAFRRHVLPEFDMRLGMVKRACEAVTLQPTA